ncbi:transcription elongation factor S-II [Nematocida sp. LUAm3]|nr:transcription elongation factor S-II [Nematocida sp. LUAm3]KAI5173666.1 transcription elongation factor S-II [Nematocida sp. LUAm2]KAI5176887.1 transcription elongation factor S-II [Nematocida sp. LUAm1]
MENTETRGRCREMLKKIFLEAVEGEGKRSLSLAEALEEEIQRISSTAESYSKIFRSKYLNLKEKSNKWLCSSVYNGIIGIEAFIKMTPEEMKSKELKELEESILKRSILDSTIAEQAAETDIFFCNKCKQRKCSYRQLQTRSADEPMTTFVHCVVCGNNWKFC